MLLWKFILDTNSCNRASTYLRFGNKVCIAKTLRGKKRTKAFANLIWSAILCTIHMREELCSRTLELMGVSDESKAPKPSHNFQMFKQFRSTVNVALSCVSEDTRMFFRAFAARHVHQITNEDGAVANSTNDESTEVDDTPVNHTADASGARSH